jgi:hypothetical protein
MSMRSIPHGGADVRLNDLSEDHFYIVYRGAEPLEPNDRGAYFTEVMSLLGTCDAPHRPCAAGTEEVQSGAEPCSQGMMMLKVFISVQCYPAQCIPTQIRPKVDKTATPPRLTH